MKNIAKAAAAMWTDESGISSCEYALLMSFVASAIMVAAWVLSTTVEGSMVGAAECVTGAVKC